jgi:sugar phosphate isomerase/epimerase
MQRTTAASAAMVLGAPPLALAVNAKGSKMRFGLVTYLWGQDWDLPTLIANCEETGVLGLELRTMHAHGVEPTLSMQEREDVKIRFEDSPVELVGYGSNVDFDDPDEQVLRQNIDRGKALLQLSHDVGGSGLKVKPNDFHEGVSREKTIEQIGRGLNEVAAFGADLGQAVRVEVHGSCSELPTMKAIFDVADHPNVGVCWNSNKEDRNGEGLEHNFNLVKDRFGETVHVRELNVGDYPYQELMNLFVGMDYAGWILLEARTEPADRIVALKEQLAIFEGMVDAAQGVG